MTISVVTICLNCREYLAQALESVRTQDYTDVEQIVIDGGSIDGSMELIRQAERLSGALRWISEPDQGISEAMNKGLAMASGDIIAFLHADDAYAHSGVLRQVARAFMEHSDADWASGGIREIDAAGAALRALPPYRYSRSRLLRNNIIFHPATFVRVDALRRFGGFDESLRYAMDYDLWLRLAELSPPLRIESTLARFRVHPGGLSTRARRKALEEEYLVRQRYLGRGPGRWAHAVYQWFRVLRLST